MRKWFDRGTVLFLLVGLMNTGLNWLIMLVLNQGFHLGYWPSSAAGYVITSVLSFVLNRKFSFKSRGDVWGDLWRFALVIAVCYFIANSLAKPFIEWLFGMPLFSAFSKWAEPVALIFGNIMFTIPNYFGQRYIAFARGKKL